MAKAKTRGIVADSFKEIAGGADAVAAEPAQEAAEALEAIAMPAKADKPAIVRRTVYITHEQNQAIKMRIATSEDRKDKDLSAIVRSALDIYLFDDAEA